MMTLANRIGLVCVSCATLVLSACGGGGGGAGSVPTSAPGGPTSAPTQPPQTPTPPPATPTPGPPGASNQTLRATDGVVNGETGAYTPAFGNMPAGGQSQTVDSVPCIAVMPNNYHVHAFIGVYNNGTYVAQPYATGMYKSQPPVNGFVSAAQCFYYTHTHDSSGIIHIEDPNPTGAPLSQSLFTLKTYLDIWGVTADATHFGPFQGPVRVFTSGQQYGPIGSQRVNATSYTFYGQDPTNIPLYSHEVIWIEVGPNYPASLPNIQFFF